MTNPTKCPRCRANPTIPNFNAPGSPRKCAFLEGTFGTDNWNCATMNALRELCEDRGKRVSDGDDHVQILHIELEERRGALALSTYKNRGSCTGAVFLDADAGQKPLTLDLAEQILAEAANLPTLPPPPDDFCPENVAELALRVLATMGAEHQLRKAREECLELAEEIELFLDGTSSADAVAGEAVDVHFMVVQVREILTRERFDRVQAEKLARTERRLANGTLD